MFTIGETAHFWKGHGGGIVVPQEVVITAITTTQITARNAEGEVFRFRARDQVLLGWQASGPRLQKLDRALAAKQAQARALEDMRRSIFNGTDIGLQAMQRWSTDEQVLRALAAAYRAFLVQAIELGADVSPYLREWLAQA